MKDRGLPHDYGTVRADTALDERLEGFATRLTHIASVAASVNDRIGVWHGEYVHQDEKDRSEPDGIVHAIDHTLDELEATVEHLARRVGVHFTKKAQGLD